MKRSVWPTCKMRLVSPGEFHNGPRVSDGGSQRLFNEQIDAGGKERFGYRAVKHRGDRDRGGMNRRLGFTRPVEQFLDRGKGAALEGLGGLGGILSVHVHDGCQGVPLDACIIPRVMLTHAAHADDDGVDGAGFPLVAHKSSSTWLSVSCPVLSTHIPSCRWHVAFLPVVLRAKRGEPRAPRGRWPNLPAMEERIKASRV